MTRFMSSYFDNPSKFYGDRGKYFTFSQIFYICWNKNVSALHHIALGCAFAQSYFEPQVKKIQIFGA